MKGVGRQCPNGGGDNREGAKFCYECASPLPLRCPACDAENRPGATCCNACAAPLVTPAPVTRGQRSEVSAAPALPGSPREMSQSRAADRTSAPIAYTPRHLAERIRAEQAALEARGAPDGERKIITALFADIKGSMALREDLDPEAARRMIDPALQRMMEAVHRYEGYVAQSLGDGIFALFGAPLAHEDHAQRALYAALRMQDTLKTYGDTLLAERGLLVQVRVGVNTGEVVVRSIRTDDLHTDDVPIGHATGLAARMESLATPGSILVTEHTYKVTEGYVAFKAPRAAQGHGVSAPVQIYEVVGVGPLRTRLHVSASRGLVRFVGRQRELEHLQRAWELAQGGHGQIVAVVGEPGVGKSRLCYAFHLLAQRGALVLETFSVSHGKASPYLPLLERLKHDVQITPQDDERTRQEKVTGKVLTLDRGLEDTRPYLLALLGVSASTAALAQMDPQIRRQRTFEALTRRRLRETRNQPVLLLMEDLHWLDGETQAWLQVLADRVATARLMLLVNYRPAYQHVWGRKTFYTQLRLDPLGPQETHALLTALRGDGVGADHDPPLQPLQQLILAKTEGNPFFIEEIVRTLLEQGVVVRQAAGGAGTVVARLTRPLTALQLPPTVQGVLAARIDRLAAEEKALLQTVAVIGKEFPLSLLTRVVEQSEEALQPLLAHLQAGEFLYEQPAFPEPEYTFKHALTQEVAYNSVLLERRTGLHERTAQAIETLFEDQLEERSSELAHHYRRSGNTPKAVTYLQRAGHQAVQRSAHAEAIGHLTTALELLTTLPDTPARAQQELAVQTALGPALMATQGSAAPDVGKAYARARELCQHVGETPQLVPVLWGLRVFYLLRGELHTARGLGEQLLTLAQRCTIRPPSWGPMRRWGALFTAFLHQLRREAHVAHECGEAVIAIAREQGFAHWLAYGTILRGWALAEGGQAVQGMAEMRQGLAAHQATGAELVRPHFLGLLAGAYGKVGQANEGLTLLGEALAAVDTRGERWCEAELYRLQGVLLLERSAEQHAEAEACLQQALAVARRQQGKAWELRAAMSLSRLWQQQGKRDAAHQLLAEVYGWFTEGFDTADLREARALLEELG